MFLKSQKQRYEYSGVWVYIDLPWVVIWQHIHPFTRYIHTEKMVDKIPASLEWGPGALPTGNIKLIQAWKKPQFF